MCTYMYVCIYIYIYLCLLSTYLDIYYQIIIKFAGCLHTTLRIIFEIFGLIVSINLDYNSLDL